MFAFNTITPVSLDRAARVAFVLLGTTAVFAPGLRAQGTPTFANVTVHDPSVVRDGATFYVFGSHLASASTTDLMHWTQITTDWNASTNPTCSLIRNGSPQTEFAAALSYTTPPDFWAPDVIKLGDGRYYFYYCVCNGTSRSALGLAVADAITGPYANVGIMLESGMSGLSPDGTPYNNAVHPNVVDPSVFFDHAGNLWMVYGSFSGGIFILSLDPSTGQPFPGQAYGKKLTGGNNCTIEGPYILYSPETSYYYLFFTYGMLDSTGGYNIRVGRSLNPDGPYLDAAGNDLTNVEGAPNTVFDNAAIAPYGVKLMGNYQFLHVAGDPQTTSRGYVSPGGTSAYYDPATGKYLMVFHTRFVGEGETHEVRVHQMFLNADGWPVVAPQRYAQETIATVDSIGIPGTFKLINHGKDITATVKTSSLITLNADQSVTGAVTGSWQVSGDHFATLTLGGVTYDGVFVRLWDDDNQIWTLTFTAISSDGVAVWGTKVAPAAGSPAITSGPANQTVSPGQNATFTVTVAGNPTPTCQWQRLPAGGGAWTYLADGGAYSGTAATALTVGDAAVAMSGDQFRCVATNNLGAVASSGALLTVTQGTNAISYNTTTFPATALPGAAISFTYNVTNTGANAWGANHYLVLRDFSNANLAFASLNGVVTGASFTATLSFTAPVTPGRYTYYVQGLENNVAWFSARATVALTVTSPAVSDFNADGHSDILWENTATGDRAIWYMNGTGIDSFGYLAGIPVEWKIAATADFDGDGQTDILWEDTVTGDRSIWLMSGTSILNFAYLAYVDPVWHIAAVGDFNGDGKADVIWENTSTGDRAIWFLNGTGIDSFGYIAGISTDWHVVGAADIDGDGQTDLIWENLVTGDRTVWFINGAALSTFGYIANIPGEWHIAMVADFDGDSHPDLLWENTTTGDRAIWLLNNTTLLSAPYLAYVDPVWHIAP